MCNFIFFFRVWRQLSGNIAPLLQLHLHTGVAQSCTQTLHLHDLSVLEDTTPADSLLPPGELLEPQNGVPQWPDLLIWDLNLAISDLGLLLRGLTLVLVSAMTTLDEKR